MSETREPTGGRRALLFGTFDVANYGDLLFPVVASHRLSALGWEVEAISPTMQRPPLKDAVPVAAIGSLTGPLDGAAILIGGGEIVHTWPARFLQEYDIGDLPLWAYASLWLGATLIGATADLPVVWNAPGLPARLPEHIRRNALEPAIAAADYVCVRDASSHAFVGAASRDSVAVVPDTVAELSRVWPLETLGPAFGNLCARKGIAPDAALMAVHMRALHRPGAPAPQDLADSLSAFATERGLTPVLVAIGPCLGDGKTARALSELMSCPHICLDDPQSLREIAAAIAYARTYVGNSMHGYVTALSYGVPGVIVAQPAFRKFSGFAAHVDRSADVVANWTDGLARAAETMGETVAIPDSVYAALDRHWANIGSAIVDPAAGRARRMAFTKKYLRSSLAGAGMGWLLQPVAGAGTIRDEG